MAFADDLLEQARHLAKRERKRPRQASLRRAISTAYYALFHPLVSETVSNWKIASQRSDLSRIFEHRRMKAASDRAAGQSYAGEDPVSVSHLRMVANAFGQLYQDRHTADYDNSTEGSRTEVLTLLNVVDEAFASWKAVRGQSIANDCLFSLFVKERQ
jgi:uncharacterized protein (UPF0332 family)